MYQPVVFKPGVLKESILLKMWQNGAKTATLEEQL